MPGRSVSSRDFPACRDARWKSTSGAFSGAPHSNTCKARVWTRPGANWPARRRAVNVTEIAGECGFNHLGRFAIAYRDRYAESPSDTLRRSRIPASARSSAFRALGFCERPTLAVIPFGLAGEGAACMNDLGDEIAAALGRTGWIAITPAPAGRYQLHGTVSDDGSRRLRIKMMLLDRSAGRYIWADFAECAVGDTIEFRDWVSGLVAGVVRSIVRDAEIDRAARREVDAAYRMETEHASVVDGDGRRSSGASECDRTARKGHGARPA